MSKAKANLSLIAILISLGLGACASPFYASDENKGPGTVPRDENGEPIWDQIESPDS